jgi:phosphoesterase RecJ-like protein
LCEFKNFLISIHGNRIISAIFNRNNYISSTLISGDEMSNIIREILDFIDRSDNFLLTTHQNADGDAFASMLAMAYLLDGQKKSYDMVIQDSTVDSKYHFLWGIDRIKTYQKNYDMVYNGAIVLDVPSRQRIGDPSHLLPPRDYCVKIDHHPVEEDFARYNLVEEKASSTSQLIYEIIEMGKFPLNKELADLIFAGIMYDTGRFSFSNTRKRDFEIAAQLTAYGVEPNITANHLFFTSSFDSMKTLGYALSHMQVYLDGKMSIIYLPNEMMINKNHAQIEELANYSVAIKGVEVGLFVREVEPHYFKVSLRSRGQVNVNMVAKKFGGGGHDHAAGMRYKGNFEELETKLVAEVAKHIK